jgi:hypothetical protein
VSPQTSQQTQCCLALHSHQTHSFSCSLHMRYPAHISCIVGGGIIGLAIARELRRRLGASARLCVLEKVRSHRIELASMRDTHAYLRMHQQNYILHQDFCAENTISMYTYCCWLYCCCMSEQESACSTHGSGRNSGVLHAGFYYTANSLRARFCRDGNAQLTQFCEVCIDVLQITNACHSFHAVHPSQSCLTLPGVLLCFFLNLPTAVCLPACLPACLALQTPPGAQGTDSRVRQTGGRAERRRTAGARRIAATRGRERR